MFRIIRSICFQNKFASQGHTKNLKSLKCKKKIRGYILFRHKNEITAITDKYMFRIISIILKNNAFIQKFMQETLLQITATQGRW